MNSDANRTARVEPQVSARYKPNDFDPHPVPHHTKGEDPVGVTQPSPDANPVPVRAARLSDTAPRNGATSGFDIGSATIDDFAPHIGSTFTFSAPDGTAVELHLQETIDGYREGASPPDLRRPFSLILVAPDDVVYRQAIRTLQHPALGEMSVFVSPFQIRDGKVHYNIVFG